MKLKEFEKLLEQKPSYFKKGKKWLSESFKISIEDVEKAFNNVKKSKPEIVKSVSKEKISNIIQEQLESLSEYHIVDIKSKKDKVKSKYKEGIHLVLSCLHVPFENKKLIDSLISFIEDYKEEIKGFHLIGDYIDMRSLAFQEKGNVPIQGLTLGYEYSRGNETLDKFDLVLPNGIDRSYIWGNHEDRFSRLKGSTDNSQYMDALPSPTQALKLKERGYEVKENWKEDYIQLGKIQLIHGIYCTQTPAKKHLDIMKTSVMFGHSHRIDTYYETDNGAFNIGCIADIDSEGFRYLSRVERLNWKNGFGLIHLDNEGNFQADVIHCLNGSFFYGGKKY